MVCLKAKQKYLRDKRTKQIGKGSELSSDSEIPEPDTSFEIKVQQVRWKPPKLICT